MILARTLPDPWHLLTTVDSPLGSLRVARIRQKFGFNLVVEVVFSVLSFIQHCQYDNLKVLNMPRIYSSVDFGT
jgi:hypothetical protein